MVSFSKIKKISKGDRLGVVSVSSPIYENQLSKSVDFFEKNGFEIKLGEHVYDVERFMAGSDEVRAKDFMDMWLEKDVDGVICARGGYSSARILDFLDFQAIKKTPKMLVGFSDNTALQLALYKKCGLPSISGFSMFPNMAQNPVDEKIWSSFSALNKGDKYQINEFEIVNDGGFEGEIVCGCLTMVISLIGTDYMPDLKGKVLVVEDVGEEPYTVDRKITQLYQSGNLGGVKALVFGQFKNCDAKNKVDGTIDDVIDDWSRVLKIPMIKSFPYGHEDSRVCLPIGGRIKFENNKCEISLS